MQASQSAQHFILYLNVWINYSSLNNQPQNCPACPHVACRLCLLLDQCAVHHSLNLSHSFVRLAGVRWLCLLCVIAVSIAFIGAIIRLLLISFVRSALLSLCGSFHFSTFIIALTRCCCCCRCVVRFNCDFYDDFLLYSSTSSSLLFGVCALLIMLWLKRSSVLLLINAKGEINGRREKNVHLYDCFRLKTHEFESMEYSNDDWARCLIIKRIHDSNNTFCKTIDDSVARKPMP